MAIGQLAEKFLAAQEYLRTVETTPASLDGKKAVQFIMKTGAPSSDSFQLRTGVLHVLEQAGARERVDYKSEYVDRSDEPPEVFTKEVITVTDKLFEAAKNYEGRAPIQMQRQAWFGARR